MEREILALHGAGAVKKIVKFKTVLWQLDSLSADKFVIIVLREIVARTAAGPGEHRYFFGPHLFQEVTARIKGRK